MTITQIEDQIRSLRPSERIELYRWLDTWWWLIPGWTLVSVPD